MIGCGMSGPAGAGRAMRGVGRAGARNDLASAHSAAHGSCTAARLLARAARLVREGARKTVLPASTPIPPTVCHSCVPPTAGRSGSDGSCQRREDLHSPAAHFDESRAFGRKARKLTGGATN